MAVTQHEWHSTVYSKCSKWLGFMLCVFYNKTIQIILNKLRKIFSLMLKRQVTNFQVKNVIFKFKKHGKYFQVIT